MVKRDAHMTEQLRRIIWLLLSCYVEEQPQGLLACPSRFLAHLDIVEDALPPVKERLLPLRRGLYALILYGRGSMVHRAHAPSVSVILRIDLRRRRIGNRLRRTWQYRGCNIDRCS